MEYNNDIFDWEAVLLFFFYEYCWSSEGTFKQDVDVG